MSAIQSQASTATSSTQDAHGTGALLRHGGLAVAAAAVATSVVAGAAHTAGVSLEVSGEPIPVTGFAVMTLILATAGLLGALVLGRVAKTPRHLWVRASIALTVLSFGPDLLADAAVSTKAVLMLTHVVAAAIVVPAVARRLRP